MRSDAFIRSLIQHASSMLTPDFQPVDLAASTKLLDFALQQASSLPSGPEREAYFGAVHAGLGDAMRHASRPDEARTNYSKACEHFGTIRGSSWGDLPQFADTYVSALEQAGATARAAAFLLDHRGITVGEATFIRLARHHAGTADFESAIALLLESAARHHPAEATWRELHDVIDVQTARAALARIVCRPQWSATDTDRRRLSRTVDMGLKHVPGDLDLRMVRGVLLAGDSRREAADDLFAVFAARPDDRAVALTLARVLLRLGRPRDAHDVLAAFGAANGGDETLQLLRAEALGRSDDWNRAIEILDTLLSDSPDSPTILLRKALGLARIGHHEDALHALDGVLARDPLQPDAWRLKVTILIDTRRLDEAGESLARALEAGLEEARAASLFLRKAKAHLDAGEVEHADQALAISQKLASNPSSLDSGVLSEVLCALGRFEEALTAADDGLKGSPDAPDLLLAKARALRQLGRQTAAVQIVAALQDRADPMALLRLHSLLLCDVGDFEAAAALLRPVTDGPEATDPVLLGIRGWAHQNLEGPEHAIEGERVYRSALQRRPDELWYRKGLANALRRIPDRLAEALEEYRRVITEVEDRRAKNGLTPHLQCLAAWSACQCGDFETAADWYTAALSARRMGPSVQFDYALVLLAGGYGSPALDEYRRTIDEIHDKDILRQCGLIYVALLDVRSAESPQGIIGHTRSVNTAEIKKLLREVLRALAGRAPIDFRRVAEAMRRFADRDESAVAVAADAPDWSQLDVVGFHRPNREEDLNLLCPVLAPRETTGVYYLPHGNGVQPLTADQWGAQIDAGEIIRLQTRERACADTCVLSAAGWVLEAVGAGGMEDQKDGIAWQHVAEPKEGAACVTSRRHGEALLRTLSEKLAEIAIGRAVRQSGERETVENEVASLAHLAVRTATDEGVAYRALLAYGVANGDVAAISESLRERLGSRWHLTQEQAKAAVADFRELLHLRARSTPPRHPGQPGSPPQASPADPLTSQLLQRAQRIGAIQDADEQFREARRAAIEAEAILPKEGLDSVKRDLATSLESQATFYLESDDSVLVLACEPAFYSSAISVPLTRPAVNSFAFVKAAGRYQGDTPLSANYARRWRLL